ncbi:hypothetical protein JCM19240_3560 [Vibrio maritimus]|uniref:Uncharacterized protein n=1 Tax=Vibrio maritimus TaxID=990268 RepID=A0A090T5D6_9VIBR|nr:hypothetical protein JCM19240_3560 [Vibrio maritimus]
MGDTRLQSNLYIANKWRRTIKREEWLVTLTVAIPPIFLLPDNYDELKSARNKAAEDTIPQENQWQAEDATPTGNVRIYQMALPRVEKEWLTCISRETR